MLAAISEIVSIVGFTLALIGISLAYREGRTSRDLQAALAFSNAISNGWYSDWSDTMMQMGELRRKGIPVTEELGDALVNSLNQLDSVGLMIESHLLARPKRVLAPIIPYISRMVNNIDTKSIIAAAEASDSPDRWRGVRILDQALNLPKS